MIDTANQSEELTAHTVMRHFPKKLHRWHGHRARLQELAISFNRGIQIRVSNNVKGDHLIIVCGDPVHLNGPFEWNDSHIEIKLNENGTYLVYDEKQSFNLVTEKVSIYEYVYEDDKIWGPDCPDCGHELKHEHVGFCRECGYIFGKKT